MEGKISRKRLGDDLWRFTGVRNTKCTFKALGRLLARALSLYGHLSDHFLKIVHVSGNKSNAQLHKSE